MTIPKNEISPSPPLPGIRACLLGENGRENAHAWCAERRAGQNYVARISDWFFAWLPRYGHTATAYAQHGEEQMVLVEGYISELAGRSVPPGGVAQAILSSYQEYGLDFAGKIRGSFTILICDSMANAAYFLSDRRRSRPMFFRNLERGSVIFSPEIGELLRVGNAPAPSLMTDAVVEFVIFGASCNDNTIFSGIHAFPQATILTCHQSGISRNKYWEINFSGQYEGSSEDSLLDECHALIQQAVRRTLRETRDPFLFLSGGVDSRVVLGALLEQGEPLPVVIYGTEEGDDVSIASEVAQEFHLETMRYQFSLENLQSYFEAATLDADCRAEVIDSPMASQLHRMLGSRFGTFMNGDECFGWHKRSVVDGAQLKTSDAIDAIGLRRLDNVGRLRDWLAPRVRAHAEQHMNNIIDSLLARPGTRHPADLMDAVYYEQRMGNMLNAFTAQRLRFMEQARPFLDEDVIEFVTKLPARYRYNKYLLRRLLDVRYPNLMKVPLATKDSIPVAGTFRRLFTTDAKVRDHVSSHLLTGLDNRLSDLLDLERFHGVVRALLDGAPLPAVRIPFWVHIPGFYRFYRVTNDVNPVNLVLRILQLNIYLTKTR